MFVGRESEISRIDEAFFHTKMGNSSRIMIIGERGIGKSSLLLYANYLAESKIHTEKGKYDFLTLNIRVDKNTSLTNLISKIEKVLFRKLRHSEKTLTCLKKSWAFLQRVEIQGVKIRSGDQVSDSELIDNCIYSLVDTIKSITDESTDLFDLHCKKDGIILLIDEADNASPELNLGTFLKSLAETMIAEDCHNFGIIVAGLPNLRDVLRSSHESSLRLFEELELSPLSEKEVETVILHGLQEASIRNEEKHTTTPEALKRVFSYSEGYPHFVQQIGSSAFLYSKDTTISAEDVQAGMFMKNGALDLIGGRYYSKYFYSQIKEDAYRDILLVMSDKWNQWITRGEIKEKFNSKDSTLNNGLKALCDRHIIIRHPSLRGRYRLQWVSFALWIKMTTAREEQK